MVVHLACSARTSLLAHPFIYLLSIIYVMHEKRERREKKGKRKEGREPKLVSTFWNSGVVPANQTEKSEVCEISGKESGTGSGTSFCL